MHMEPIVGRFSSLLSGSNCPKPLYDQVLSRTENCVVAPTLGSIVPNWLLVIPELSTLNFSEWARQTGRDPSMVVKNVLDGQGIAATRAIWFEHGPSVSGTKVGCGVDHAHLHLLLDPPFDFADFVTKAKSSGGLNFDQSSVEKAYRTIPPGTSYVLLASEGRALIATKVDNIGSQFLRRAVAEIVGRKDDWDYRVHPHLANVQKTIQSFHAA